MQGSCSPSRVKVFSFDEPTITHTCQHLKDHLLAPLTNIVIEYILECGCIQAETLEVFKTMQPCHLTPNPNSTRPLRRNLYDFEAKGFIDRGNILLSCDGKWFRDQKRTFRVVDNHVGYLEYSEADKTQVWIPFFTRRNIEKDLMRCLVIEPYVLLLTRSLDLFIVPIAPMEVSSVVHSEIHRWVRAPEGFILDTVHLQDEKTCVVMEIIAKNRKTLTKCWFMCQVDMEEVQQIFDARRDARENNHPQTTRGRL